MAQTIKDAIIDAQTDDFKIQVMEVDKRPYTLAC
jgi:hypothetical protein